MAGQLRAVPDRPLRALGVVRVSKKGKRAGDDFISPDIQQTAIRDCAARLGYVLAPAPDGAPFLYGIDESGSQDRSRWWRKLDEAVGWVEEGLYDVIVVWEFSRAARNRRRWAEAIDRVERAGGVLESATERVDVSTSAGRFQRGMLAEVHAYRAEAIGDGWRAAHRHRVEGGRPHTGKPKWGYVYDPEAKLHRPDPVAGPVLAEMYRRYVAGESVYQLVRWLNGHGWKTTAGGAWSDRSLRRVLDSGFGAGLFMAGGDAKRKVAATLRQGVHEPVIDEELWQAYLDARVRRRSLPPRVEASTYLLSGMVRCARCGGTMTAMFVNPGTRLSHRAKGRAEGKRYSNGRPHLSYRCKTSKEQGPDFCPGTYVRAGVLEEHVVAWLREVSDDVESGAAAKVAAAARRAATVVEGERLAREAARVHEAMVRLTVQNAQAPVPESVFRASMEELRGQAAVLEAAAESAGREVRQSVLDPVEAARGLLESGEELPVVGRREVLRRLLDCVLVRTASRGETQLLRVVPVFGPDGVRVPMA